MWVIAAHLVFPLPSTAYLKPAPIPCYPRYPRRLPIGNRLFVTGGGYQRPLVVSCEERERLTRLYHEAALKVQDAGTGISDMTSAVWKDATSAARQASKTALQELNRHRKEHGC